MNRPVPLGSAAPVQRLASRLKFLRRRELNEEPVFSSALQRAVNAEARIRSSRGFDEEFWTRLEERRERNATWRGKWQQLLEAQLGGVAVWRVFGPAALGAALPALLLACCALGSGGPVERAPRPLLGQTITPWNQRRFWEELAWKNPTRPVLISLLDPKLSSGGEPCVFRFVV